MEIEENFPDKEIIRDVTETSKIHAHPIFPLNIFAHDYYMIYLPEFQKLVNDK